MKTFIEQTKEHDRVCSELAKAKEELTTITQERDAAVELLREFIASTDNAGTYMAGDRVPSCGCCQREEHHPNCPVLRAKAFLTPTPPAVNWDEGE